MRLSKLKTWLRKSWPKRLAYITVEEKNTQFIAKEKVLELAYPFYNNQLLLKSLSSLFDVRLYQLKDTPTVRLNLLGHEPDVKECEWWITKILTYIHTEATNKPTDLPFIRYEIDLMLKNMIKDKSQVKGYHKVWAFKKVCILNHHNTHYKNNKLKQLIKAGI